MAITHHSEVYNRFTEKQKLIQPRENRFRLVFPGETIEVVSSLDCAYFVTDERRLPDFGDVCFIGLWEPGMPRITGEHWHWLGCTVRDGVFQTGSYEDLQQQQNEDLFDIDVTIEPAPQLPDGYVLLCQMHMDGVDRVLQCIMDTTTAGRQDSLATTTYWRSLDLNDPTEYSLFAAPTDTTLLSSLSFSFCVQTRKQETSRVEDTSLT